MKKIVMLLICFVLTVSTFSLEISPNSYIENKFEIKSSLIFDGGGYRTTYINVIVYRTDYSIEEIVNYHAKMNGTSNELIIRIYPNKKSLLDGDFIAEKTFFNK